MNRCVLLAVLAVLSISILTSGCRSTSQQVKDLEDQVKNRDASLNSMQNSMNELQKQNRVMREENIVLRNRVGEFQDKSRVLSEFDKTVADLIKAIFQGDSADVTVGPNYVRFSNDFLFDPGSSVLKEKPKKLLNELSKRIVEQNIYVRIDGHTDTDPIKSSIKQWKTGSNFELAAHRGLGVLLYLQSQGVPANRMFVVSWGEHRPLGDKKAQNRRVELYWSKWPHAMPGYDDAPVKDSSAPVKNAGSDNYPVK